MPYQVEFLPDERVIFARVFGKAVPADADMTLTEVRRLLDAQSEPVRHIIDFTDLSLNLDDILKGSNEFARGSDPVFHHRNLSELIFVTAEPLIQLTAEGLHSETFGHVNVRVFATLDEALDYVRGR